MNDPAGTGDSCDDPFMRTRTLAELNPTSNRLASQEIIHVSIKECANSSLSAESNSAGLLASGHHMAVLFPDTTSLL